MLKKSSSLLLAFVLAISAGGLLLLSNESLVELVKRWSTQKEYGHAWLVPAISGYLFYGNYHQMPRGSSPTLAIVVWGIACLFALTGWVAGLFFIAQLSVVLSLIAILLLMYGRKAVCLQWASLVFLIFAIPLPYMIEAPLTAQLQLISSQLAVWMIAYLDMPVYLAGNVIDLGVLQLQVVEACSGLRYIFPLMSLGFLAGYFYRGPLWARTLIFASTIPIAVVSNSVRIAVVAWLATEYQLPVEAGVIHDLEGLLLFLICMIMLFIEISGINLVVYGRQKTLWLKLGFPDVSASTGKNIFDLTVFNKPQVVIYFAFITLVSMYIQQLVEQKRQVSGQPTFLAAFPLRWDGWKGLPVTLPEITTSALLMDDYLSINYSHSNSEIPVNFFVSYYASQRSGQSPHSPKVCIPGGGWNIALFERDSAKGLPFNRVVIAQGERRQLVQYWFVERGRPVANEYYKKWLLIKDFVAHGRTDGALVRITTPVHTTETLDSANRRLTEFRETVAHQIMFYLPANPDNK